MTATRMDGEDAQRASSYTATVNGIVHRITLDEVERFAAIYFRDAELRSRVSRLLVLDLWLYMAAFGQNPAQITHEIDALEGRERRARGTKPATKFDRSPLVGLWHKHWFSSLFMARNIQTGLAGGRLHRLVEEATQALNSEWSNDDAANAELAYRMSHDLSRKAVEGTLERRRAASALTGQWIVFAKHEGQNFYLCLSAHKAGDQAIFARIRDHCFNEFPFLRFVLAP